MKIRSGPLSLIRWLSLLLLVVAIVGCGKKEGVVSGKVTYNGKIVTGGYITFEPTTGTAAKGDIRPDGTYSVSRVSLGDNKVVIDTETVKKMGTMMDPGKMGGPKPPSDIPKGKEAPKSPTMEDFAGKMPVYMKIPEKYGKKSTTPLELKVSGSSQKKDFELTD